MNTMINTELLQSLIGQINGFVGQKINIQPAPVVQFHTERVSEDDFLIPTGNYDSTTNTINLFTDGRHLKDILRSYTHELVHHAQHLKNPTLFDQMNKGGKLIENDELRKIEGDAYLNGNLLFRMWTESVK